MNINNNQEFDNPYTNFDDFFNLEIQQLEHYINTKGITAIDHTIQILN